MSDQKQPNTFDKALVKRQIGRAKKLEPHLLRCRVGGDRHRWTRVRPDWEPSNKALPLAYQCDVCLTVKRMDVDPTYGVIIGRPSYDYPNGYRVQGADEVAMSPQAVRAVTASRVSDDMPGISPQWQ